MFSSLSRRSDKMSIDKPNYAIKLAGENLNILLRSGFSAVRSYAQMIGAKKNAKN